MSASENVEIMRRLGAAFEARGVAALREFCDPQVEWHEDPAFPEAGVYRGFEAVEAYAEQFFAEFSEMHYEIIDAVGEGDHVVSNLRITGVGRTSGAEFELAAWWAATVRGGKIVRVFAYLDRERAFEAVGLAK